MYVTQSSALTVCMQLTVRQGPSPGDHETAGDLCWDEQKRTFYMTPKRKTWPYAPKGIDQEPVQQACRSYNMCLQRMPI